MGWWTPRSARRPAALFFEQRRATIERAHNLRESADMHRKIYQAIRSRDPEAARAAMDEHVRLAQIAQATDDAPVAPGDR